MTTIFISHSSVDDSIADQLSEDLQTRGYATWVDHKDIPVGAQWVDVVEQALEQSDVLLLLLSEDAKQSHYVKTEWQAFYSRRKRIIPVKVRQCAKPLLLNMLQDIDFTDKQVYDERVTQLLEVLPEPTPEPAPVQVEINRAEFTGHFSRESIERVMRITQAMEAVEAAAEIQPPDVPVGEVLFVFLQAKKMAVYSLDEPLIVGRTHESSSIQPDIDLTPFGADRKGVSRRHAMLVQTMIGLTLTDLDSRNGTFVGNMQLVANQAVRLKNKSLVRFGGLVVQIHFKEGN